MADLRTVNVIEDTGSEELKRLRKSYNALLDVVGDLLDALETAAAVGDVNTAATNALAVLETNSTEVVKVGGEPGVPNAHQRAVQS